MLGFFTKLIHWSFYLLVILVPIIFTGNTSELFEFNKMWITFGLTLIIVSSWIGKMLLTRQIKIRRTILDIPILLFLFSQILATIFSLDPHTSLWGYYTRFNGGLYSLFAYGFLYFAFTSNVSPKDILKYLYIAIGAAVIVGLWGFPSHFGYDPTCLVFRQTFDVSCWTAAFQPKVRIFSTLGQPDWLAAYLVYMLPITTAFGLIFWKYKQKFLAYTFLLISSLFYADLLFTKARSGFIAFGVSFGIFLLLYIGYQWRSFAKKNVQKSSKEHSFFLLTLFVLVVLTFLIGIPISPLDKFSLGNVQTLLTEQKTVQKAIQTKQTTIPTPPAIPVQELGGTDSGKIRLFVWEGALQIFLHNPLFGTGVETFAYSYYQYRPAGHNLTSEWDYLYNKAHNEFLNYLATTGIVGFGTYLILLGYSIWFMTKSLVQKRTDTQLENTKVSDPLSATYALRTMLLALLCAYLSILVTNFFGFSVVIMNILLFLTPAFALFVTGEKEQWRILGQQTPREQGSEMAWIGVSVVWILCCYFLIVLLRFWLADVSFALGQNLDHANEYQAAYSYLHDAAATRPSEPTFQDELSINDAVLSTALFQQKDSTNGAKLRDEAITVSDAITTQHPSVVTFWKSRVRIFYTLAQVDPQYLGQALDAIQHASKLAPTDAKVWYNLGLLYDQTGKVDKAIATERQTVALKPDYRDAYYALALFYRQKAVGQAGKTVIDQNAEQQAVTEMHFILDNFGQDKQITDTLSAWGEK
ncbi:MAG TPA: O-antigen ligase family protein [Patescibacteria group bacterium]|nr:O-antigen ligase family protein [Patescibacteria group bacterium]